MFRAQGSEEIYSVIRFNTRQSDPDDDLADLAASRAKKAKNGSRVSLVLAGAIIAVPWMLGVMLAMEAAWRVLRR
jgi:hypothetical protein